MCGASPTLPPAVDPKAEREKIAAEATTSANAKAAMNRKSKRSQSLLASGAMGSTGPVQSSSILAQGQTTMGAGGG